LRAALPALLGALSNGASAGLSLQACMRHVAAEHAGGPLGEAVRDMLARFDANEYRTFGQALEGLAERCDTPELERVVRQLAANAAAGAGLVGAIQELLVGLRAEDRAALVANGHKKAIGMLAVIAVFLVPPLLVVFLFPVIVLVRSFAS
jgi:pilus assembly protein TadC